MSEFVFVTGGTGFVGSCLVERLRQQGEQVRCLVRENSKTEFLSPLGVELFYGSFSDPERLAEGIRGAKTVYHLAGLTRAIHFRDFDEVNRTGCHIIAEATLEASKHQTTPPTIVSVSSLAAAGSAPRLPWKETDEVFGRFRKRKEEDPPAPISYYGRSKLRGEMELLSFSQELPITIARPPYIFGAHDLLSLPLLKMAAFSKRFPTPGYFDNYYSFIHVEDLAECLIRLSHQGERIRKNSLDVEEKSGCSGEGIYFTSNPTALRLSEFGRTLARFLDNSAIKPIKCPPMGVLGTGLVQEIYKRFTGKLCSLDLDKAVESLNGPWICSESKLLRQDIYSFPIPLEDQLRFTAEWFKNSKFYRKK